MTNTRLCTDGVAERAKRVEERVHTWPALVRIEFLAALMTTAAVLALSIFMDAPLDSPANSQRTPAVAKAPWYFAGLQELLVYFDPWLAGVVIPFAIVMGLAAIPYLDVNPTGSGDFAIAARPFAVSIFGAGFAVLWCGPIVIGSLFRGPEWAYVPPWNTAEAAVIVPEFGESLPWLFGIQSPSAATLCGIGVITAWLFFVATAVRLIGGRPFVSSLGPKRFAVVSLLLAFMGFIPLKALLGVVFGVKYVITTSYFNV